MTTAQTRQPCSPSWAAVEAVKTRYRITTDGRVGWPSVAQYELLGGPDKGRLLSCPPRYPQQHDASDPSRIRATWPYLIRIHDMGTYRQLADAGFWHSDAHCGPRPAVVDNRRSLI